MSFWEGSRLELTSRPVPIELILLGGGIILLTPFANKLVVELVALVAIASLVIGLLKRSGGWLRLWRIASFFWLLALFSPVDLALRSGGDVGVSWVPVVYGTESSRIARTFQTRGYLINQDYLVYSGGSLLIPCRRALLLRLPIGQWIRTPVFSFLRDGD